MIDDPRHASADVLRARETSRSVADAVGHESAIWKLRLRVLPPAEPAFEISVRHPFDSLVEPRVGSQVNVRYDANDHSKLAVEAGSPPPHDPTAAAGQPEYPLRAVMRGARIGIWGSSADNKVERDAEPGQLGHLAPQSVAEPVGTPPESAVGKLIDAAESGLPIGEQAAALLDATAGLRAPPQAAADKLDMLRQMRARGELSQGEFEAFTRRVLES